MATKTTTAKKSTKKTSAKKSAPKKSAAAPKAKSATAKKATAKKATAKKATTKKSAPAKKSAARSTASKKTATKAAPKKTSATKTSAKKAPAKKSSALRSASPKQLAVREDESPWTKKELAAVRTELEGEVTRLRAEIQMAESDLVDLMRDPLDGAGDDQADAGAKSYERDQEITLTNNARSMLIQNMHALERLDDGSYGTCESCGNPVGKLRLQAYPRATLCVSCKSRQERR